MSELGRRRGGDNLGAQCEEIPDQPAPAFWRAPVRFAENEICQAPVRVDQRGLRALLDFLALRTQLLAGDIAQSRADQAFAFRSQPPQPRRATLQPRLYDPDDSCAVGVDWRD